MSRHSDELKSILKAQAGGALAFRALAKARGVEQWAKKLSKKYGSAGPGGIGSLNPKVMYVFDHRPEPDEFSELEAEHAPQDIYVYWYNQCPLPEEAWPDALEGILRLIAPPKVINYSSEVQAAAILKKVTKELGIELMERTSNQYSLF